MSDISNAEVVHAIVVATKTIQQFLDAGKRAYRTLDLVTAGKAFGLAYLVALGVLDEIDTPEIQFLAAESSLWLSAIPQEANWRRSFLQQAEDVCRSDAEKTRAQQIAFRRSWSAEFVRHIAKAGCED
jgi:hypothetical protein